MLSACFCVSTDFCVVFCSVYIKQIDLSGNPSISDNQINACVGHGVVVCNGGKGKLSKNFIHHNSLFGVNISTDACAVVMENHIHDNIAGQLLAESGAAGIVKE